MLRTHTCGELSKSNIGREVTICGWVNSSRNHGNLIFTDIRDRYGLTQVVFDNADQKTYSLAEKLRREDVVCVKGDVQQRKEGFVNSSLATGEIEVHAKSLEVLTKAEPLPIEAEDENTTEESRLKYRYLDLRRPVLQKAIITRHMVTQLVREYLNSQNFLEIETPVLGKSTPEGARDYLVPSRVSRGRFYALPQSPQLYKQILMISGFDRYYQIARCLRDEDLRADRQPEFTQIDMEMSFIQESDIQVLVEGLLKKVWKEILDVDLKTPFPRMTYQESVDKYGIDRPDTRFDMLLHDITPALKNSGFKVFDEVIGQGGIVKCIVVKNPDMSRKELDKYIDFVKTYRAKGLIWMKKTPEGLESSISKFLSRETSDAIIKATKAEDNDIIMVVADRKHKVVNDALAATRLDLGRKLGLIDRNRYNFLWVVDFPMFEWSEEEDKYVAMHHPFTSPKPEDLHLLEAHPEKVRARAYDVVLNGTEVGGGSIRIHDPAIQERVFSAIGLDKKKRESMFGFLLEAFRYGAPPHGGLAIGYDRMIALLSGTDSIRDVIAFPKTKNAECLMTGAPSDVSEKQLKELNIRTE